MVKARLKRFFHCLFATLRLKSCRAVTIWTDHETIVIGCDCGKVFYSKDEESTARFDEFIHSK